MTNNGPNSVTGAILKDPTSPGEAKVTVACSAAPANQCTSPPPNLQLEGAGALLPTLNSGQFFEITIITSVVTTGTSVSNTATVATPAGITDPTPANNSATDTDTVTPAADLSITKSDGVTSISNGSDTTYTIRVTNNGPNSVTGAILKDPVSPGEAKVSVACSAAPGNQCTSAPPNLQLEGAGALLPTLNSGQFFEITIITSVVTTAASVSNTATVATPAGITDPIPGNNSATDTDTVTP